MQDLLEQGVKERGLHVVIKGLCGSIGSRLPLVFDFRSGGGIRGVLL